MARVVQAGELRSLLAEVFKRLGLPEDHALVTSDALVNANLRCVDSHGVSRGIDFINGIKCGEINSKPEIKVVRESEVSVLVDGDRGIGIPVAYYTTLKVIEKARKLGVGVGAARNLWNVGTLAYYVMMVAKEGFVGIAMANSKARVSVPGVKSPIVGTNPIAVAIPAKGEPIVLDMAISTVAVGKIVLALRRGERIPEGWAVTKDGRPTTDPRDALEGYLLPIGGYKGLGLGIVVDILSGILADAPYSLLITGKGPYTQGGFLIIALDPGLIRDRREFIEELDRYVATIKSLPKDPGVELMMPGEPEARCYNERLSNGIPIDESLWEQLVSVARELGVRV